MKTNYSLSDTVFAKAELKCDGRVCIWLGVRYTVKGKCVCFVLVVLVQAPELCFLAVGWG